ncbi:MAG TPA: type I-C CRISPR-associated endonuclease Cas1 [Chlorobaculum sp.]|uniref:CRISPR-associated endonuclease Cas1 1 n=1 Tax=Chlorobaculum tepidum (strain ATCC 49652 / DSM 12025 / NBRC 103806 / TLS) TaxID=194439 RepID=CAS1A_CHLTE|nr:type I-C CRISPR-associated endonuclease Cas1c [Chlorobaculum tepidum]Q8KDC4.1 RecName: Full=CRISPR-associated endonuclease Cas1 1 [Chlorobaculum tepidum TLS]AAM72363.1 CRISPR-associated protein Cas1A [Chlorobaculum tepidum TLS]HBU23997.1 type I-C CRISPR-associated endonuclease Cas1 [Chlorobaculum sp.]
MKKHLNTLFVTTQGSYLSKEGECVLISIDRVEKTRIPLHMLNGIVCFGQVSCSPFLLGHCAQLGVAVTFLTEHGRFLCQMQGPVKGNILLRRAQYRMADNYDQTATLARLFVIGKIGNARVTLARALRDHPEKTDGEKLKNAQHVLAGCIRRLQEATDQELIRGIEGEAAKAYFSVFDECITADDPAFRFEGRSRRPPLDRVNCLLSFVYTLMTHDIRSALESCGLDPAAGFLHKDRPGRPSLALDMLEEFRSYIGDRLVLSLINRGQIHAKDFDISETGAVAMKDDARKTLITAYQQRKQEEIEHPFVGEKMAVGLLWHMQAMLLARYIRGDIDMYPPFVWR